MAVALRGAAVVPTGNPTTGFNLTIPSAVDAGDDLYLVITSRDHLVATAYPTVTDNDTGGNTWTRQISSVDRKAHLFWKKATSSTASKTITVAGCVGSASGVLKAFSGGGSGDPTRNALVETNLGGDEAHATWTPTTPDACICTSIHNYANDNAVTSMTWATAGAATVTEFLSTGGSDCATAFGHRIMTGGPAATGQLTWAQTDGTTYSIQWSIAPLVTVALTPATATWSSVAVTPVAQPVTAALAPAAAVADAQALTPAPQPVTVALTPAAVAFAAIAVSTSIPPAEVALSPAAGALTAQALTPVPQPVSAALAAAASTWAAVAVSPEPGQVSTSLGSSSGSIVAVALMPVPQPVTIALAPAGAGWSAIAVDPAPGAVTIALSVAVVAVVAVPLSPVPNPGTVDLAPAVASWAALALTPAAAAGTVDLAPSVLMLVAVALAAPLALDPETLAFRERTSISFRERTSIYFAEASVLTYQEHP